MSIAKIMILIEQSADGILRLRVVAIAAVEFVGHECFNFVCYLILAGRFQSGHPLFGRNIAVAGELVEQTLQIAGNKDIHRR